MEQRRKNMILKIMRQNKRGDQMTVLDFWSNPYKLKVSNKHSISEAQSILLGNISRMRSQSRSSSRGNRFQKLPEKEENNKADFEGYLRSNDTADEKACEVLEIWLEKTRSQDSKRRDEDLSNKSRTNSLFGTKYSNIEIKREGKIKKGSLIFEGENDEKELTGMLGQETGERLSDYQKTHSSFPFKTQESFFLGIQNRGRKKNWKLAMSDNQSSRSFIIGSPKETAFHFFNRHKPKNSEQGEEFNVAGYVSYIAGASRNCSQEGQKIGRILKSCEKENKENTAFKKLHQKEMERLKNKYISEAVHEHMTKMARQREQAKQVLTLCVYKGSMKQSSIRSKLSYQVRPKPYMLGVES